MAKSSAIKENNEDVSTDECSNTVSKRKRHNKKQKKSREQPKKQNAKRLKKSQVEASEEVDNDTDVNSDSPTEEIKCELNLSDTEEQNTNEKEENDSSDGSEPEENDDSDDNDVNNGSVRVRRKKFKKDASKEARTIFVGNVPLAMTAKELRKVFRNFGKIESVRFRSVTPSKPTIAPKVATIMKNQLKLEHRNSSNAYIVFKEETDCEKALSMNGHIIDGHHLRVDKSNEDTNYSPSLTAFVGNLPRNVTEEDLWQFFGEESNIKAIRIIRDRVTGFGKGIAFVMFASKDDVALALEKHDLELNGKKLRISRFQCRTGAPLKGERVSSNRSKFRKKSKPQSNSGLLANKAAKPKFKKLKKIRKNLAKKQQIAEVLSKK